MHKFNVVVIGIILIVLTYSCLADNNENEELIFNSENLILKSSADVFKTIPTPIETASIISKSNVNFNKQILNHVRNVHYYETSSSMALNLGIYCADMSYTSFYDQRDITFQYLSAIKTLSEGLGISKTIDENDIIAIEDNLYNKDSIKNIVQDIFFSSGKYLNENNNPEQALLIEVGAWIEGLYIALKLSIQSMYINKELVDRIVEQSNSLDMIIHSLNNYIDYTEIKNVLQDMESLKKIYSSMKVKPIKKTSANKQDNSTNNTNKKIKVTPDIFINLYNEINRIRNSYTQ